VLPRFRSIAIHLPQYHPIPENDRWWGKGFTEWTNVAKASPLFRGHYQPHLPADLGFYDLRLKEVREQQANLAKEYGIDGFCYYHYWFNGQRILERPVEEILTSGEPDFPFMLCWANENWTRRWDGQEQDILLKQEYSQADDIEHMHELIRFFKDERYIRVGNRPVFIIYKPFLLPDATQTALTWRKVAAEYGIDLYLCHMVFSYQSDSPKLIAGFDAAIDFEPFGIRRKDIFEKLRLNNLKNQIRFNFLSTSKAVRILNNGLAKISPSPLNRISYNWLIENLIPIKEMGYKIYPSLTPGWDNTARKKKHPTLILEKSTPELFSEWYKKIIDDFVPYSAEENFVFINAWNEWGEGNHLEPCQQFGLQYLEALKKVIDKNKDFNAL
jgi:lipopolysaccharide biosynthesis protein